VQAGDLVRLEVQTDEIVQECAGLRHVEAQVGDADLS
jgi:hypothetical protein